MSEAIKELTDEQLENMSDEAFEEYYDNFMNNNEQNGEVEGNTSASNENNDENNVSQNNEKDLNTESNQNEDSMEEPNSESDENSVDEMQKKYKFKANGVEYEATLGELINKYAPQAVDYTQKTQKIAPYRKHIEAMQQKGVTPESINVLIDLVSGDKEKATGIIKELIKQHKIDPFDLDMDDENSSPYRPTDYSREQDEAEFKQTIDRLKQEPELFIQTSSVVNSMDDASKNFLLTTPGALEGLQKDIKEGKYAQILPVANDIALRDNFSKPALQYYLAASHQIEQQLIQEEYAKRAYTMQQNQALNTQKAKCSMPAQRATSKKTSEDAESDIWNMSDEEFEKRYKF